VETCQNQPGRGGEAEETGPSSRGRAAAEEEARKTQKTGSIVYRTGKVLINLYLTGSSTWTGASSVDTTYTGSKTSAIYLASNSKWIVNGNSTIDNLYNAGTIVDSSNKTVSIVADGNKVVTGTSDYTITVTSTYSTTANLSSALTAPSWSDYEVSKHSDIS
jgi:hypothetical protein